MLDMRKTLFGCVCSLALLASVSLAGNIIANGDFASNISQWLLQDTSAVEGSMNVTFDAAGNPGGSTKLYLDAGTSNNGHRFYQAFSVTSGRKYRLSCDWKGDINGTYSATDANFTSARNWIEVVVFFLDTPPTSGSWGGDDRIMYKKRWGSTTMNEDDGIWDWESILISMNTGTTYVPVPSDGVFTATDKYMVVGFNLGGVANSASVAKPAWVLVDNVRILPCFDDSGLDCAVDFRYMAWVTGNWLGCNVDPITSCW